MVNTVLIVLFVLMVSIAFFSILGVLFAGSQAYWQNLFGLEGFKGAIAMAGIEFVFFLIIIPKLYFFIVDLTIDWFSDKSLGIKSSSLEEPSVMANKVFRVPDDFYDSDDSDLIYLASRANGDSVTTAHAKSEFFN